MSVGVLARFHTGRAGDQAVYLRGAFDAFSLERGAYRGPTGCRIVVFGVSYVAHDRFPARKAPIVRMCPTLVAVLARNDAMRSWFR